MHKPKSWFRRTASDIWLLMQLMFYGFCAVGKIVREFVLPFGLLALYFAAAWRLYKGW